MPKTVLQLDTKKEISTDDSQAILKFLTLVVAREMKYELNTIPSFLLLNLPDENFIEIVPATPGSSEVQ